MHAPHAHCMHFRISRETALRLGCLELQELLGLHPPRRAEEPYRSVRTCLCIYFHISVWWFILLSLIILLKVCCKVLQNFFGTFFFFVTFFINFRLRPTQFSLNSALMRTLLLWNPFLFFRCMISIIILSYPCPFFISSLLFPLHWYYVVHIFFFHHTYLCFLLLSLIFSSLLLCCLSLLFFTILVLSFFPFLFLLLYPPYPTRFYLGMTDRISS